MFISGLTSTGALPTLEMGVRFAAQRQRTLAHNIANLATPGFQPKEVSPRAFQEVLGEAVDRRRSRTGGMHGALDWRETAQMTRDQRGNLKLVPQDSSSNVLFHDRNNRDLERMMADLAENVAAYRVATDLLRSRVGALTSAIRETP
ncbi:MAG: hypothetical protein AAFY58_00635 [Planctomycetota bacterium]